MAENIEENGENRILPNFLPFPHYFQKTLSLIVKLC